jgi:putative ABC transport system ATP-binding protein
MPDAISLPATSTRLGLSGIASPNIRARKLNFYYGEGELRKQVLYENNLDVMPGEIVIMTGPSGSGKTTLLTLIGGLRSAKEGSLLVLGKEMVGASPGEIVKLRRQIGFIFQAHNLFESLTAYQNVKMALELFDFSQQEMRKRIVETLTRLGLEHRIHYKPDSLSGGQRQRVAIARGLVHRPRLILADEPTAALDEQSGREVVTLFQELAREEGCTILIVTHDNRILDVADRIVNMVDGRIKSNVFVEEAAKVCEFLQKWDLFRDLTPRTLAEVADNMFRENFPAGEVIIRQGDPGDKFYLIRRGSVEVETARDGKTNVVAVLGEGDFFGEMALLNDAPRNATVRTREDTVLYSLGKDDFMAVIAASATFEEELRKALFERQ